MGLGFYCHWWHWCRSDDEKKREGERENSWRTTLVQQHQTAKKTGTGDQNRIKFERRQEDVKQSQE